MWKMVRQLIRHPLDVEKAIQGTSQFAPADALGRSIDPTDLTPGRAGMAKGGALRPQSPEKWFTRATLMQAWLAVKRAGGGAGVDGVTLAQFEASLSQELSTLRAELAGGVYRPRPPRRIFVPKSDGGLRPLTLWALRDRIAQRAVYDLTSPLFETVFLPCSYGFRPGLGVAQAIEQVIAYRQANRRWVVDADIYRCFDEIDTRRLLRLIRRRVRDKLLLRYMEGWLNARILNGMDGKPRRAGTSQGGVLSPLFANIYLHEMDRKLVGRGLSLARYADDFVICTRRKAEAQEAMHQANRALHKLGLRLHPQKTRIVHFDQGFSWLGYFFLRSECHRL